MGTFPQIAKICQSLEPRRLRADGKHCHGYICRSLLDPAANPCLLSLDGKQRSHSRACSRADVGLQQSNTWRRRLWLSPTSACSWSHEVCSSTACPAAPRPAPRSWGICSAVSPLCVCLSVCLSRPAGRALAPWKYAVGVNPSRACDGWPGWKRSWVVPAREHRGAGTWGCWGWWLWDGLL